MKKLITLIMILICTVSLNAQNINDNIQHSGYFISVSGYLFNGIDIKIGKNMLFTYQEDSIIKQSIIPKSNIYCYKIVGQKKVIVTDMVMDSIRYILGSGVYTIPYDDSDYENTYITTSIGDEINKTSKLSTTATIFYCAGTVLIGSPYFMKDVKTSGSPTEIETALNKRKKDTKILIGSGVGMFVVGTIIQNISIGHLKLAGKIINMQAGKDGFGLKIKL
jgi:hypothetical protein